MNPIQKIFGGKTKPAEVETPEPSLATLLAGCATPPTLSDEFETLSCEEKAHVADWLINAQCPDTDGVAISEAQLVRQWHGAIGYARAKSQQEVAK